VGAQGRCRLPGLGRGTRDAFSAGSVTKGPAERVFAAYWPKHGDVWPLANAATKYVASNTITSHKWQPSVFLNGNIAEKIGKIKQQPGPDLHVYGSANLVQTLLKHDLVDALWLKIFPVTLGAGKKLFADGTIPAAFKVTESTVTSKGVVIINYERAGVVQTGSP
jgi:dihydrofolate reductase